MNEAALRVWRNLKVERAKEKVCGAKENVKVREILHSNN